MITFRKRIPVLLLVILLHSSISVCAVDTYVEEPDLVPAYLWAVGCTPMSASMILGYWDNYDFETSTGHTGYDRLMDYYIERDVITNYTSEKDGGYFTYVSNYGEPEDTVPFLLIELGKAFDTSSAGTSYCDGSGNPVKNGLLEVTNTDNGYSFTASYWRTNWDYAGAMMTRIRTEIDNNRPFMWNSDSDYSDGGHSVCGLGYTDDDYVIVYNTWDTAKHWWFYYNYQTFSSIIGVIPGGSSGLNTVELSSPDGAEEWYGDTIEQIEWQQWGSSITLVNIYYSRNDGYTWSIIESSVASNSGENSYDWSIPEIDCEDVMVKIEGNTSTGTYMAGDGSMHSFTVKPIVIDYNETFGYPNPCYMATAGYVTMPNIRLTATDVEIYIYNIAGELVRVLSEGAGIVDEKRMKVGRWDGKNEEGEKAASGIYVYLIKGDEDKIGKVAILW